MQKIIIIAMLAASRPAAAAKSIVGKWGWPCKIAWSRAKSLETSRSGAAAISAATSAASAKTRT
jgi:hypothetical protein